MSASQAIAVDLEERTTIGKGLGKLRAEGKIPTVIHDHGKASTHAMGDFIKLTKVFREAGKHHPVQIQIGKVQHLALIKDVDFDPTRHDIRHIVFQAIKQNETVEAEVPLHITGEIPAERKSLMVLRQLDHVTIEALPRNLVDEITIDGATLAEVGDSLSVTDIVAPEGVTITTDPTSQIAIVEEPRVQAEEPAESTEAVDAASVPSTHGGAEAATE